jgi:hypothetical protein
LRWAVLRAEPLEPRKLLAAGGPWITTITPTELRNRTRATTCMPPENRSAEQRSGWVIGWRRPTVGPEGFPARALG